jgi:peptide/nickel transport system substrate-binding protein
MPGRTRQSREGRTDAHPVLAAALAVVLLAASGCTGGDEAPPPPAPSSTPRPFTVMTTDRITTADPAAVTDQGSAILVGNVFQRLIMSDPGESEVAPGVWAYKPDLARECSFTSRTAFTCILNENLHFSNGDPITSADVKFSIDRAIRLDVPGSSAGALESLRRIETPDPLTVRFVLSRYDRQFGWALAGPAASIVDRSVYDPDELQGDDLAIVGSGPFKVATFEDGELVLTRFDDYIGWSRASTESVRVLTAPDSGSIEDAMQAQQADLVWRGLSEAAVSRADNQIQNSPTRTTSSGFTRLVLPGARVLQLSWNPASPHRRDEDLRAVVAGALQEDRTLASVVPPEVPGYRPSFPLGGRSRARIKGSTRIPLTLGYDPTVPDGKDLANQLRSRLEDTGGMSVRLRPGDAGCDLRLEDRKAWTPTAIDWLQPVLQDPLPSSASTIRRAEAQARGADAPSTLYAALGTLQSQAAKDGVLLPLTQRDEYVYVREGAQMVATSFGPGWQLGLWGISTS